MTTPQPQGVAGIYAPAARSTGRRPFAATGANRAQDANNTMLITNMIIRPKTKLRPRKIADVMNGRGGASIYTNLRGYAEFGSYRRFRGHSIYAAVSIPLSALLAGHSQSPKEVSAASVAP